jgi:RNA polymerase sigma factor (sigma-70 family)
MNLLETYLRDISRYQPITPEQEQILAQAARQGDAEAREQLIHAHLLMVINIARQYQRPGVEMLDLIQEGNIGLIKAVDMFDPAQGNRLSTLARFWVEKYILRFLRDEPDEYVSLDMPVVDSGETLLLSETIKDKATILGDQGIKNIDRLIEQEEQKRQLLTDLEKLSSNEQQVLQLLYGLNGYPCMTREEISKLMSIQTDQISRIKTRALRRLKKMIE